MKTEAHLAALRDLVSAANANVANRENGASPARQAHSQAALEAAVAHVAVHEALAEYAEAKEALNAAAIAHGREIQNEASVRARAAAKA
jgi:hypothetical protein